MKLIDYKVCFDREICELQRQILELAEFGYVLVGGLSIGASSNGGHVTDNCMGGNYDEWLYQAMALYE